jgi:hypothetical protein
LTRWLSESILGRHSSLRSTTEVSLVKFFGVGLLLLSALMLFGFLRSDVDPSAPATVIALLIVVGLPALGGGALHWKQFGDPARLPQRRDELRRQTLQAEVLKLAGRHQGKLTVVRGPSPRSQAASSPDMRRAAFLLLAAACTNDSAVDASHAITETRGDTIIVRTLGVGDVALATLTPELSVVRFRIDWPPP